MRLLVDLGNTRLKWAFDDGGAALEVHAEAWDTADALSILARAAAAQPLTGIWLASVVSDERERALGEALRAASPAPLHWVRTPAAAVGVRNAYAEPGRLGVDRFLGLVAAFDAGHAPCVLVGCGTALTLDALASDGQHLGGWIAPGPRLMQQSVMTATARVWPDGEGHIVDVAGNTADGLASGCWHAAAALVERFVARVRPQLGPHAGLWLGGGDAQRLSRLIGPPWQVWHDVVLHGLCAWARAQP